jgi:hypothetical protein
LRLSNNVQVKKLISNWLVTVNRKPPGHRWQRDGWPGLKSALDSYAASGGACAPFLLFGLTILPALAVSGTSLFYLKTNGPPGLFRWCHEFSKPQNHTDNHCLKSLWVPVDSLPSAFSFQQLPRFLQFLRNQLLVREHSAVFGGAKSEFPPIRFPSIRLSGSGTPEYKDL